MKKSVLEIYALTVCLFTVTCFVIVLGIALWNVVKLSVPGFTIDSTIYEQHQTDEAYKNSLVSKKPACNEAKQQECAPPSGEALTKARLESYDRALKNERRSAAQSLAQNSIILLIDIVVFLFHWTVATRARRQNA